jgi:hypothetical protein
VHWRCSGKVKHVGTISRLSAQENLGGPNGTEAITYEYRDHERPLAHGSADVHWNISFYKPATKEDMCNSMKDRLSDQSRGVNESR